MHAPFVHLRLHSAYSLAESTLRIKQLAALVSGDRQPAAAITDTNNMFGALEFSQAMMAAGVQPIIGTQMTLSDAAGSGEVVLLAMNETGYTNLCRLQSQALLGGRCHQRTLGKHGHARSKCGRAAGTVWRCHGRFCRGSSGRWPAGAGKKTP